MKTDILFVVTTADAAAYLQPMLEAANRASCNVAVFLTNDGVKLAGHDALASTLSELPSAVVCMDSWSHFMPGQPCPITSGSQTDLSRLVGECRQTVSL